MSKFVLDCGAVSSIASNLQNVGNQMSEMSSVVSGYNVSEATEFNFSSALSTISSNINDCTEKINNTTKLINTVIETHTNLQSSLSYSPGISGIPAKSKNDIPTQDNSNPTPASNQEYTIQSGDNLSKIASQRGITLLALLAANPQIQNSRMIHTGDKINIPNGVIIDNDNEQQSEDTEKKEEVKTSINYQTKTVDGNKKVQGNSGYTINEVLKKIKNECEKQGIGNYWKDACAISLWETGTYSSTAFKNNNIGGMSKADGKTRYQFDSLDSGIERFVSNLNKNYISQGLTSIDKMANKYCPPTANDWASNVNKMKNQIS